MQAFNKIGFHGGGRCPAPGLVDWMQALDEAEIPFFFAAPDATSGLAEAQQIAKAGSVPHSLVYCSTASPVEPDYYLPPAAAARVHWELQKTTFPEALDRSLVWFEPLRSVPGTFTASDWLGQFGYRFAQLALADGFRVALFGFEAGAPESDAWDTPGMRAFLAFAATEPDRVAVSLQEFSGDARLLNLASGERIGRCRYLFEACDQLELPRPTVLITACGWTKDEWPGRTALALEHVEQMAEQYAEYPELRGAALWSLDILSGIGEELQQLIESLTPFTLAQRFETGAPAAFASAVGRSVANAILLSHVTIPDETRLYAAEPFTKTWFVENNGTVAWDDNFELVHAGGNRMEAAKSQVLPAVKPDDRVELSLTLTAPETPDIYRSDWRFRDADDRYFGDFLSARIVSQRRRPTGASRVELVADVTIPLGSEIAPDTAFVKTWRLKNTGTRDWSRQDSLRFVGGMAMTDRTSQPLFDVPIGQEADVSLRLAAPATPGRYTSEWRLADPQGRTFGPVLSCEIEVAEPGLTMRGAVVLNRSLAAAYASADTETYSLYASLALVAGALGRYTTAAHLRKAAQGKSARIDETVPSWRLLSDLYRDVSCGAVSPGSIDLLPRIDAELEKGCPVLAAVAAGGEADGERRWVVIMRRDRDDYLIADPTLWPPQESSLRLRYGTPDRALERIVQTAVFHHVNVNGKRAAHVTNASAVRLQTGMNIAPHLPLGEPTHPALLQGVDWVRFPVTIDGGSLPESAAELQKSLAHCDLLIRQYRQLGIRSLLVLQQQTAATIAPWRGVGNWKAYAQELARTAGRVARRYRSYGDFVAYQIWQEPNGNSTATSEYVEPQAYAPLLWETAAAIRDAAPDAAILTGGLAGEPQSAVAYLQACCELAGEPLPVDALGIHPYTRWGTRGPFDWQKRSGRLDDAFSVYTAAFPDLPMWITEIGVVYDQKIHEQFHVEIGEYMLDTFRYINNTYAARVPVVIWYGWSDRMRHAGVVDWNGKPKPHLFEAFRRVRNRDW